MEFVDPRKLPYVDVQSRGELPHLYKPGGIYFVTFRLADAVRYRPRDAPFCDCLDYLALADAYDPPLTLGSCTLRSPLPARILQDAMLAGNGDRYELAAWCIMPNHAHAVVQPLGGQALPTILQSWKGGSARRINQAIGRTGPLWERESFDHLIRTEESLLGFVGYCHDNPVVAGLCEKPEDWPFSSAGEGYRFDA